jgi:protein-S-isoprenylcysteine O-methyltransferase Ste14
MIGIFERIANALLHTATGDPKRRWALTPVVGLLFLCFLTLFLVAAFATDKWLNLPFIIHWPWTLVAALILFVPGFILWLWTVILFVKAHGTPVPVNPPNQLVVTGPYAYCRNPMMLGIFMVFFGVGLWVGSTALTFIFTPLFIIVMTVYHKKVEEKELVLQFGEQYINYKKKVPMYIPSIRRFGK